MVGPLLWLGVKVLKDPRVRQLVQDAGPEIAARAIELAKGGRWRQLAVLHAELVPDGSLLEAPLGGAARWVVWSGEDPVAAYPEYDGDLRAALAGFGAAGRLRPAEAKASSAVAGLGRQGTGLSGRLWRDASSVIRSRRRSGAGDAPEAGGTGTLDCVLDELGRMPTWAAAVRALRESAPAGQVLEYVFIASQMAGEGPESLLGFFSESLLAVSKAGVPGPAVAYPDLDRVDVARSRPEREIPDVLLLAGEHWRFGGTAPIVPTLKSFIDQARASRRARGGT